MEQTQPEKLRQVLDELHAVKEWFKAAPNHQTLFQSAVLTSLYNRGDAGCNEDELASIHKWVGAFLVKCMFVELFVNGYIDVSFDETDSNKTNPEITLTAAGVEWFKSDPPMKDDTARIVRNMLTVDVLPPLPLDLNKKEEEASGP